MAYYEKLYQSAAPSSGDIDKFLDSINLNMTLSDEHRKLMDAMVTESELTATLKMMKNNKATGRDGFPSEFYKLFSPKLVQRLLDTFNYVLEKGVMPETWSEARIVVIPKPGKDVKKVESFRPISLLNHDAKLFASILARRLNKIISQYIHPDQAGFIPKRQLTGKIRKTLNIVNYCNNNNISLVAMVLDAEKAFDRVETNYLLRLLQRCALGPHFLNALQALYKNPRAQLYVNNL